MPGLLSPETFAMLLIAARCCRHSGISSVHADKKAGSFGFRRNIPCWYQQALSQQNRQPGAAVYPTACQADDGRNWLVFNVVVTNFVKKVHGIKQAQTNNDGEASKRNKNHRVI